MNGIEHLILEYRYWILIPLCFVEGPIVAFVAGALASLGYFNVWFLALLFFARDIGVDLGMYAVGHYGRDTRLTKWFLKKIKVTDDHLEGVRRLWEKHPGQTMFFSKLSYGLAATFIAVAGLVRMSLKKFVIFGAIVTVLQYGTLLALGYFFGGAFGTVSKILDNLGYVLLVLSLVITAYYIFTHFMRTRLLEKEKAEEGNTEQQEQK